MARRMLTNHKKTNENNFLGIALIGLVIPIFTVGLLSLIHEPIIEWALSYIPGPFVGDVIFIALSVALLFLISVHVWMFSVGILEKNETISISTSALMIVYGIYGVWHEFKTDELADSVLLWFGLALWGWSLLLAAGTAKPRSED